jgi:CBS domain-containing protein
LIVKRDGKPWGIFTERDLLTKVIYKGESLNGFVGDFCSSPLIKIESNSSIHKAAKAMAKHHIRRLLVSDNEELSGIITARDLVEAYAI